MCTLLGCAWQQHDLQLTESLKGRCQKTPLSGWLIQLGCSKAQMRPIYRQPGSCRTLRTTGAEQKRARGEAVPENVAVRLEEPRGWPARRALPRLPPRHCRDPTGWVESLPTPGGCSQQPCPFHLSGSIVSDFSGFASPLILGTSQLPFLFFPFFSS